jgi:hypothetical protein
MADSRLAAARIRYNYACGYCGVTEISTGSVLTLDHYQPKVANGSDKDDNLVYACIKCNQNKHAFWPTSEETAQGNRILHPLLDNVSLHFFEDEQGYLQPLTPTGIFHIALLDLNRLQLVQHRLARQIDKTMLEKIGLLEEQGEALQIRCSALERTVVMLEAFLRR